MLDSVAAAAGAAAAFLARFLPALRLTPAFLAAGFLAALRLAPAFLAAGFLAALRLAPAFLAAGFLAALRLAAGFLAAARFLAAGFLAALRLAPAFLAAGFLAATRFLAAGFLAAARFLAAGFLAAVFFFAAGRFFAFFFASSAMEYSFKLEQKGIRTGRSEPFICAREQAPNANEFCVAQTWSHPFVTPRTVRRPSDTRSHGFQRNSVPFSGRPSRPSRGTGFPRCRKLALGQFAGNDGLRCNADRT